MTLAQVRYYLDKLKTLRGLIIGETIIDQYHYGTAIGKAKDAVVVLRQTREEKHQGGILNLANHLRDFCKKIDVLTNQVSQPPIIKSRFVDIDSGRKLLETYIGDDLRLTTSERQRIKGSLVKMLSQYDFIICVDYGHGLLDDRLARLMVKKSPFLGVNAQANAGNFGYHTIARYSGADYICINEIEARLEMRDRLSPLRKVLQRLVDRVSGKTIAITRRHQGCLVYHQGQLFNFPGVKTPVVDTIGSGDAFLAFSAPLLKIGAPLELTMAVGNCAGALAVGIAGNRSAISPKQLLDFISKKFDNFL